MSIIVICAFPCYSFAMSQLRKTFRVWWKKPKRIADLEDERQVSFLELFYDLVYVVIIIQLTHSIVGHLSWQNLLGYVGIYAMVWFAWMNGSLYHELHGNNDIRSRVFTFLQMFALLWMAIFVPTALTADGYQGFAIAYSGFLLTLTYLWWRTGVHDPEHRPLSGPYSIAYLCTTAAFVASTQLSIQAAHIMWAAGIGFALFIPVIMRIVSRGVDREHMQAVQTMRPSIVERFGLLTIILLGEVLISIVSGASHLSKLDTPLIIQISISVGIVFFLWWMYFDFVSHRLPKRNSRSSIGWMYFHLPLTISIGLVAVGLLNAIELYGDISHIDRWLIVLPVASFLGSVVLLIHTLNIPQDRWYIYRKGLITALISAVCIVAIGFTQWGVIPVVATVCALLVFPVFSGFKVWLRRLSYTQGKS